MITPNGLLLMHDCSIAQCSAVGYGGAICAQGPWRATGPLSVALARCEIRDCRARANGGAINFFSQTFVTISDCTFTSCCASFGGAIETDGTSRYQLDNCAIDGCNASFYGGGIYHGEQTLFGWLVSVTNTITDCAISNCVAGLEGGGLAAAGASASRTALRLLSCDIRRCRASGGGGILLRPPIGIFTLELSHTSVSENVATDSGGGILHVSGGVLILRNQTRLSGNVAASGRNLDHQAGSAWYALPAPP